MLTLKNYNEIKFCEFQMIANAANLWVSEIA